MQYQRLLKAAAFALLAFVVLVPYREVRAQSTPPPSPSPDKWRVTLTPYVWLPTANGSLHFTRADIRSATLPPTVPLQIPNGADFRLGPNSYLSHLNAAAMFAIEARRGNGGFFGDLIYTNLSSATSSVASLTGPGGNVVIPLNISSSARTTSTIATIGLQGGLPEINGFLGLRYLNLKVSAGWSLTGPLGLLNPNGTAERTDVQTVPIVGIKGRIPLGQHFFIPYYGDYGANGAVNSWQYIGGFAYGYHSGAAIIAWRQLAYGAANGNPNELIQLLQLGGPAVGWSFYL